MQMRLDEATSCSQLQLEGLEQLLGGVSFVPETSQDLYWRFMHSSAAAAAKLTNQRRKTAAGTSLQRALEGMLAYFWAHTDPDTCHRVVIMRKAPAYLEKTHPQRECHPDMQWFALEDKVLQDAVLQHQGVLRTELGRLGYSLSYAKDSNGVSLPVWSSATNSLGDLFQDTYGSEVYLGISWS